MAFIPLLILIVAVAPIFCPCHDMVIGLIRAPGATSISACQCAPGPGVASRYLPKQRPTGLYGISCGRNSEPMCLDHLFKGVLRDSATTICNHFGHSFAACLTALRGVTGAAVFATSPQRYFTADAGAKTLLRQRCALII